MLIYSYYFYVTIFTNRKTKIILRYIYKKYVALYFDTSFKYVTNLRKYLFATKILIL